MMPAIPTPSRSRQRAGAAALALAAAVLGLALAGCSRGHDHAGAKGHVHTAPHGGLLVELGAHQYNLEFVFDASRGVLQAYVLDAHAEAFVRVSIPEFVVTATAAGQRHLLLFQAVANPVTGETVGNTSTFEAPAPWLRAAKAFDGTLQAINVRGVAFSNVTFRFALPPPADAKSPAQKP